MSNSSFPISILICAYTLDRWKDLCEAVDSARNQLPPPAEIVLVIDHNLELKARCEAEFPDAVVIENREQPGLSGARNSGIVAARGTVVAFLDDDAVADRHWAARLLAQCQEHGVLGATARVEPLWIGARPSWFPDEFLWVVGCSYRGLPSERQEIRNLSGGACCFRRDLFRRVGGFSSRLGRGRTRVPLSCEETELCIRARQSIESAKFIFEPSALIYHKVPARRLTWSYFGLRCYAEGLSKAYLAVLAGRGFGLASERKYVRHTLSAGLRDAMRDAALGFDPGGLGRAAAILYGLGCAAIGYIVGKINMMTGDGAPSSTAGIERAEFEARLSKAADP